MSTTYTHPSDKPQDSASGQPLSVTPPRWDNTDMQGVSYMVQFGLTQLRYIFNRYIRFRGNKASYLRHLGLHVGNGCQLIPPIKYFGTEPWLIEIGNRVTVTGNVFFVTHDGAHRVIDDAIPGMGRWGNRFGTIKILDNCFIGMNTLLMPGITIGPNSIVAAGSIVNKDVKPNTVAGGVPAHEICSLDEYTAKYKREMVPLTAKTRDELRKELTQKLWGEVR